MTIQPVDIQYFDVIKFRHAPQWGVAFNWTSVLGVLEENDIPAKFRSLRIVDSAVTVELATKSGAVALLRFHQDAESAEPPARLLEQSAWNTLLTVLGREKSLFFMALDKDGSPLCENAASWIGRFR